MQFFKELLKTRIKLIVLFYIKFLQIAIVQWRARNFAHIGHFTGIILLK
jgi:hypothetical protein